MQKTMNGASCYWHASICFSNAQYDTIAISNNSDSGEHSYALSVNDPAGVTHPPPSLFLLQRLIAEEIMKEVSLCVCV